MIRFIIANSYAAEQKITIQFQPHSRMCMIESCGPNIWIILLIIKPLSLKYLKGGNLSFRPLTWMAFINLLYVYSFFQFTIEFYIVLILKFKIINAYTYDVRKITLTWKLIHKYSSICTWFYCQHTCVYTHTHTNNL